MQMPWTFLIFICLCGTVLLRHSLRPLQNIDAHLETSSETTELETPGHDAGLSLSDTDFSGAAHPIGKMIYPSDTLDMISCTSLFIRVK